MCNFIVTQITPVMLQKLRYGTFIFYGILTFAGGIFVWLCVPETKRLTLEEMDAIFGSQGVAESVRINFFSSLQFHWLQLGIRNFQLLIVVLKDARRMAEITDEIGLDQLLKNMGVGASSCSSLGDDGSQVFSKEIESNETRD